MKCRLHENCYIEGGEEFCSLTRGVLAEIKERALIKKSKSTRDQRRKSKIAGQKTSALRIAHPSRGCTPNTKKNRSRAGHGLDSKPDPAGFDS